MDVKLALALSDLSLLSFPNARTSLHTTFLSLILESTESHVSSLSPISNQGMGVGGMGVHDEWGGGCGGVERCQRDTTGHAVSDEGDLPDRLLCVVSQRELDSGRTQKRWSRTCLGNDDVPTSPFPQRCLDMCALTLLSRWTLGPYRNQ